MSDPSPRVFLPLGIDLRDRPCLVVGGGAVSTRKVATLVRAGARVTVVAPDVADDLRNRITAGELRWVRERFTDAHLDGMALVVAATDDVALNAAIARLAHAAGSLACNASSGTDSPVIFGALLERNDLTVAVFTGGRDPAAARRARDRIAETLDREAES